MSLNNPPAKMDPKSPPPRHVVHSMQSIMGPSNKQRFPSCLFLYWDIAPRSIETDVLFANVSSLPLSICLAGDMPQPDDQPKDYKSVMGGITLDSASLTGIGEQDIENMEKNPEVRTEEDRVDKE